MIERIGRDNHDCQRDELPQFMDGALGKYSSGDIVRCSCGRVYYVEDGTFCHYRQLRGKKLKRALALITVTSPGEPQQ